MKKFNNFTLGLIVGIIAPAMVIVTVLLTGELNGSFGEILSYAYEVGYLNVLMRPALLANLAIFIFFFNMRMMKICRGLIIATFVFGLYLLVSTFVF